MTLPLRRPSRSRRARTGQVLLIAVLLMIVVAVLGSTFAAVMLRVEVTPIPAHRKFARLELAPLPTDA